MWLKQQKLLLCIFILPLLLNSVLAVSSVCQYVEDGFSYQGNNLLHFHTILGVAHINYFLYHSSLIIQAGIIALSH